MSTAADDIPRNRSGDFEDAKFTAGSGSSRELKAFVKAFAALAERTETAKLARQEEWPEADTGGNGVLSLTMIERWIQQRLSKEHGGKDGQRFYKAYIPAYIRAFQAAQTASADAQAAEGGSNTAGYVSRAEFRLLCAYLCLYALAFDSSRKIAGSSSDRTQQRISLQEWINGSEKVGNHGFLLFALAKGADEEKKRKMFEEMEGGKSGSVAFSDWRNHLIKKEVETETPMGKLIIIDTERQPPPTPSVGDSRTVVASQELRQVAPPLTDSHPDSCEISLEKFVGQSASSDVKIFLSVFLPLASLDPDAEQRREEVWQEADTYGNGALSLTTIERWAKRYLQAQTDSKTGAAVFKKFFASIIRSFSATRESSDAPKAEDINRSHFRLLNGNLCFYALAIDAFNTIDTGASGNKGSKEGLSKAEWLAGREKVENHGFVALKSTSQSPLWSVFDRMDDGGSVMLTEFCNYLKNAEVHAATPIGELVSGSSVSLTPVTAGTETSKTPPRRKKHDEPATLGHSQSVAPKSQKDDQLAEPPQRKILPADGANKENEGGTLEPDASTKPVDTVSRDLEKGFSVISEERASKNAKKQEALLHIGLLLAGLIMLLVLVIILVATRGV